ITAALDGVGNLVKDGAVTPDGYLVNNQPPLSPPHRANVPTNQLVPLQTMPHIGDRLDGAGVSWAWYSGGWHDALAGKTDTGYAAVESPFAYFADAADGTPGRQLHLKDEQQFFDDVGTGVLPQVVFIK